MAKANTKTKYGTSNAKMTSIGIKGKMKSKSKTGKIALPGDPDKKKFNANPKPKKAPKGMKTGPIALGEGSLILPNEFPLVADRTKFNANPKPKKAPKAMKTGPIALGEGALSLPSDFNPVVSNTGLKRANIPSPINTSAVAKKSGSSLKSIAKKGVKGLNKYGGAIASAIGGAIAAGSNNKDGLGALRGIGGAASGVLDHYLPGVTQLIQATGGLIQDRLPPKRNSEGAYAMGKKTQDVGAFKRRKFLQQQEATYGDQLNYIQRY